MTKEITTRCRDN